MRVTMKAEKDWGQFGPNPSDRQVGVEVTLQPVYEEDPASPNYTWSKATPSGEVRLTISKPDAHQAFKVGATYLVTFSPE